MTEDIVVARKLTVFEYEGKKEGINPTAGLERFKKLGSDGERILRSHLRQLKSFDEITSVLDNPQIIVGDEIDKGLFKPNSLVIALGGDNYFQHVAHFIDNQLILGINADPETSSGALLNFTADSFIDFLPRLQNREFNIDEWVRLQARINGQRVQFLATSEIYIGAYKSTDMSRYSLKYPNRLTKLISNTRRIMEKEEQKSSGIIVATASAGLTGWYKAAAHITHSDDEKEANRAWFTVREPFKSKKTDGYLNPHEQLMITWLAHNNGMVNIDASDEHEVKRGDTIEVRISDQPLRVVTP